jgi:hypothetical protein
VTMYSISVDPWLAALFAAGGLAFGWGYFAALRRGIDAHAARGSVFKSLLWMLARLAAAALFFAFAVRWGAWPLVAAFLGFLAARQIAVRAARRAA